MKCTSCVVTLVHEVQNVRPVVHLNHGDCVLILWIRGPSTHYTNRRYDNDNMIVLRLSERTHVVHNCVWVANWGELTTGVAVVFLLRDRSKEIPVLYVRPSQAHGDRAYLHYAYGRSDRDDSGSFE